MMRKEIKRKKALRLGAYFIAVCMLFSGCGKKDKGSLEEDYKKNQEIHTYTDSASDNSSEDTAGADTIEWVDDYVAENGKSFHIEVSCEFDSSKKYPVLAAKEKIFNAKEKEKMLKAVAQGDIYKSGTEYFPKAYWAILLENARANYERMKNDFSKEEWAEQEKYYQEDMERLQSSYDAAPDESVIADNYEEDEYTFDIDGVQYIMLFPYEGALIQQICLYSIFDTTYFTIEDVDFGVLENKSGISSEEAEKIALDFLKKLGIEGFSVTGIKDAMVSEEDEEGNLKGTERRGCCVQLARKIENIPLDDCEDAQQYIDFEEYSEDDEIKLSGITYYGKECIQIVIYDGLVKNFSYYTPIELGETLSEDVSMLSLDSVKQCFLKAIEEESQNDWIPNSTSYDYMKFAYVMAVDPDNPGLFTLVPAWMLGYEDMGGQDYRIVINAIDGSVIKTVGTMG